MGVWERGASDPPSLFCAAFQWIARAWSKMPPILLIGAQSLILTALLLYHTWPNEFHPDCKRLARSFLEYHVKFVLRAYEIIPK